MQDMLLQETYYGKLPEFDKLETLFEKIRKKVLSTKNSNPNKFPEVKEIQKIFCKLFGFKKSIFYWEALDEENAYTFSLNTFIIFAHKGTDWIQKTDHGFYDTSHTSILTVYFGLGLITQTNLSARELLACVLHEIGHNFDESGYHMFNYHMVNILNLGLYTIQNKDKDIDAVNDIKMKYHKDIEKYNDKYYKNSKRRERESKKYLDTLKRNEKIRAALSIIKLPFSILNSAYYILFSPIIQLTTLAGKKGEIFADSFATAYGYGPDLISALEKLSGNKKYNPKSKVMRFLQDLGHLQFEIWCAFSDVHGSNQERCIECKRKLEADLKSNDFPPELKEELQKEIDALTQRYKDMKKLSNNDRMVLCTIWRKINAFIFRSRPTLFHNIFKSNKV